MELSERLMAESERIMDLSGRIMAESECIMDLSERIMAESERIMDLSERIMAESVTFPKIVHDLPDSGQIRNVYTSAGSVTIAPIPAGVVQSGIIAGSCRPLRILLIMGCNSHHLIFRCNYAT